MGMTEDCRRALQAKLDQYCLLTGQVDGFDFELLDHFRLFSQFLMDSADLAEEFRAQDRAESVYKKEEGSG